jgi:hypothetical protein
MNHDFYLQINYQKSLDVLAFYERDHSLKCPSHLWFQVIQSSLKLRHTLIILEEPSAPIPIVHSTNRWGVNETSSWLTPRSLGPLTELNPHSYQELKNYLRTSK